VLIHGGKRDLLLILDDEQDSGRIWLTQTSAGPVLSYGPYLVRSAQITGGVLSLRGDTSASFPTTGQLGGATDTSAWSAPLDQPAAPSPLRVLAGPSVTGVTWNGSRVAVRGEPGGSLAGSLPGPPTVSLPALRGWRFATEAPEAKPGFQDSGWTKADHMTTNNVANPPDNLPVLYMDDYGFHYGNVWYRGHFTATGSETGVSLDCASGGSPDECLIWFNGRFLAATSASGMQTYPFPPGSLVTGQDNVVSVLVQSIGHPEDFVSAELHKAPRGLRGASLPGSPAALSWLIQGALGGEHPPSMLRGPLNNGGLFGERTGWSLPGFDDSSWKAVALPDRWAARNVAPGVGWYRTNFSLNLPAGADIPIGLRIADDPKYPYSALIFVNGWMLGQYVNDLGPQHLFYLPEGILNPHGSNDVAIAVNSRGSDGSGGGLGTVSLRAYGRYGSTIESAGSPRGSCQLRLPLSFRVHQNNGRVTRVQVSIDGRRVKVLRGRRITRVTLRAPGHANFTVRIVAFTVKHKRVVSVRHYHLCRKAPPRTHVRHRRRH
jgi:beta-galactosidase